MDKRPFTKNIWPEAGCLTIIITLFVIIAVAVVLTGNGF
jgi:hypothetical protein